MTQDPCGNVNTKQILSWFFCDCDVALASCTLTRGDLENANKGRTCLSEYLLLLGLNEPESAQFDFLCSTDRKANKSFDLNLVCQHNWLWGCLFSSLLSQKSFFLRLPFAESAKDFEPVYIWKYFLDVD